MEIAKVSSKGQITIPIAIREKLGVKEGDKVVFVDNGQYIAIANSTAVALKSAQRDFEGEADKLGLTDEQDVADMVKEIRRERWKRLYENND